ncbi:hypothetical protein DPMN_142730 [Dreissena polymorpha]|uniref:Uncharacterized protein n=1 Tax=Dreissena polymorpha TaxID=45954 RepID=A0A9D4JIY9_DREPO|nr:hypothetical protein DPMN_142730 [Dreissena polymorpha]
MLWNIIFVSYDDHQDGRRYYRGTPRLARLIDDVGRDEPITSVRLFREIEDPAVREIFDPDHCFIVFETITLFYSIEKKLMRINNIEQPPTIIMQRSANQRDVTHYCNQQMRPNEPFVLRMLNTDNLSVHALIELLYTKRAWGTRNQGFASYLFLLVSLLPILPIDGLPDDFVDNDDVG